MVFFNSKKRVLMTVSSKSIKSSAHPFSDYDYSEIMIRILERDE